jgi:hypothetical protein
MTAICETTSRHHPHAGVWRRATHALGKLWAKEVALPVAPSAAARREVLPPEYFNFPPY